MTTSAQPEKSNPDGITPRNLASGEHYYSDGEYLRRKHRLAGDQFVRWALGLVPSWESAAVLDAGGGWGRFIWSLVDLGLSSRMRPSSLLLSAWKMGLRFWLPGSGGSSEAIIGTRY
jgi:hypothetical protein